MANASPVPVPIRIGDLLKTHGGNLAKDLTNRLLKSIFGKREDGEEGSEGEGEGEGEEGGEGEGEGEEGGEGEGEGEEGGEGEGEGEGEGGDDDDVDLDELLMALEEEGLYM